MTGLEKLISGNYGMYTSAGNKSIENKFKTCIEKLKNAEKASDRVKALEQVVCGWRRMHNTKTMAESGDTAVREVVWHVLTKVGEQFNIPYDVCDWIWDTLY